MKLDDNIWILQHVRTAQDIWNLVFLPAVSSTLWAGISSFFQTSCSFSDGISSHIKCEKYWTVGSHCLQLFWVVMLTSLTLPFLCLLLTTLYWLLLSVILRATASYFFLLLVLSSVYYCLLFVYFCLLLHVTSQYYR